VLVLVLAVGAIATAAFYGFLLNNRRLQQLADAIPGLVSYLDSSMRYRFVNRTYADWFDIDPATLIGKTPRFIADEDAAGRFEHYLRRGLAGEVVTYEIEQPFPRTDRRLIRGHFVPDFDRRGRVRGVFSLTLDIEIEDANRRVLDGARNAALAESRAKSSFLATASHDLRQPLHALTLFLSALDRRVQGEETKAIVSSMRASVRSMQDMFRTLLDISKIDAGVLVPAPQPFAIGDLIQRLTTEFQGPAAAKGITLRDVPTRARVLSDPVLIESILRNLLSNAVKFTRQGGIVIGARRRGEMLRLAVYDSGPGIAAEQQERVFDEFERVGDKSAAEGLGLGLAIVRRLARLLETEVHLRSTPGRGSCFWLDVPLALGEAPAAVAGETGSASLVGRRILIVDDNFTLASAMARELGDRGCLPVMAGDASQALAALARAPAPEVAVLDYDLGRGLNGVALAAALDRARGKPFPAIFVTGSTDPSVIAELTASGRPFLTKPVDAEILAAALAALLAPSTTP
jgi:signal transduction histidine kinase/CheY-like chemotaxis protein